jgi:epoxyqueuosine reductase
MSNVERIKEKGRELGFELIGVTRAVPSPELGFFRRWLDLGFAATMAWLKRGEEKRADPEKILPGIKSIICCGLNYYAGQRGDLVSRYAQGKDYHLILGEKLKELEKFILEKIDPRAQTKSYVDTGPILERSYAAQAGLGWIGKNTMLINNGLGSFFFIGEILTTLALEDEDLPSLDQCGSCSLCLDACPTGALTEPYTLDSNRCIAYLTIEHRGDFLPEQEKMMGGHLYGCDICQEVCPYNDRIPITPIQDFHPDKIRTFDDWNRMTEEEFLAFTKERAMNRIKFPQWKRNLKNYLR